MAGVLWAEGLGDLLGGLLGGGSNPWLLIIVAVATWFLKGRVPNPSPSPAPAPTPAPTPAPSIIPDIPGTKIDDLLRQIGGLKEIIAPLVAPRSTEDSQEKALVTQVSALLQEIHEHTQGAYAEGGAIDLARVEKILQLLAALYPILQVLLRLKGVKLPDIALRPASLMGAPVAASSRPLPIAVS